jgi:hypothetical protein
MQKLILKYGFIAGSIVSAFMLISISFIGDTIDYGTGELLGYISMIVALSAIFIGIKSYRDNELNGTIGFAKAFQVGLLITLVASLIYVASWVVYINTSDSDFINTYKAYMIEELEKSGEPQEVMDQKLAEIVSATEMYQNPLAQIAITFLEIFPVGLLVSLIAAALLQKKPSANPI